MKLTVESPELTALVLGELSEDKRREVEAIVSIRPDLQAEVEQLRSLTKIIGSALQAEPAWRLSAERRLRILKRGAPARKSRRRNPLRSSPANLSGWFPWTGWAVGVSVTAVFGLACLLYLHQPARPVGELALLTSNSEPHFEAEVFARNLRLAITPEIQNLSAFSRTQASALLKSSTASTVMRELPVTAESVVASSDPSPAAPMAMAAKSSLAVVDNQPTSQFALFSYIPPERLSPPLSYRDSSLPPPIQMEGFDDSGYRLVRTRLLEGVRPLPEFVRLEELINYFRYDSLVSGPLDETNACRAQLELVTCPWNAQHALLRVAIQVWAQPGESQMGKRLFVENEGTIDGVPPVATNLPGIETGKTPALQRFAKAQPDPVAGGVMADLSWNTNHFGRWRMLGHGRSPKSTHEPFMSLNSGWEPTSIEPGEINPIRSGSQFVAMYELAPQPFAIGGWGTLARDATEVIKLRISAISVDGGVPMMARKIETPSQPKPFSEASVDFRFSTAVVGFGLLLRDSEDHEGLTWDMVLELARSGIGADVDGTRAEFVDLVTRAKSIPLKPAAKKVE